ncbi:hypothetical protein Emed_000700 [Eimeria media]
MLQASGQQYEKPPHEERPQHKHTGTQQQEQQQHDGLPEVAEGAVAATGSKSNEGLQGPLQRMLHELQLQQPDVSLLAESLKYLDNHGWLLQQQPLPAAAAAATRHCAAGPSTLPLFVQRQRLDVYRQQLQAFRQILPMLLLLMQIADSLSSNLAAATARLSTERQNLLPLLQELLHLRQQRQHVEDTELVCQTILKRFLLFQSTIKSMTRPLPPASATEETVTELRDTRQALHMVQEKRQQLRAAAAAADVGCLLLEDLVRQMQELQDVGYERLFLLVLQRLQQLAASATATRGSSARDTKDPISTSVQALHEITKKLQKATDQQQHMTPPALGGDMREGEVTPNQAEPAEAEVSVEDAALWEALADLYRHPAYVLQCLHQLLRLRRQVLAQRFMASTWGPLEFANAAELHSPFELALEWVAVAAAEEADFFMCLSRLFPSSDDPETLEEQQQKRKQGRLVTTPGQILEGPSSNQDGLPASHDSVPELKRTAAEESSNPQQNSEQQLQQGRQDLVDEGLSPRRQTHQQEQELRHEKREWLPLSEVPNLPWEVEGGGPTVPQLLSPLPLIEAALEVLEGPLAARLSRLLSSDTHSRNSNCGILALKAALSLQRVAAKIEEILAGVAAKASPQYSKQEQDEQQQRKPVLSKFLLELAEKALLAFEDQWEAAALHLPQLTAATAAKWSPTAGAWEPGSSSLPSFLTHFAARLQDLLLALATSLPPEQQQTQQQQEQQLQQEEQKQQRDEEISTLQRLDALLGRDVLRAANYCLQAAHHMEKSHACVFIINALCCLRSALQPLLAPFSQAHQQQQPLQQIEGLRELQQQRRLLSQLIEEKTAELGALEGSRLSDSFGVTLRLEAIEAYAGVERSKASQLVEQQRKKSPVESSMSRKAAEDLLTREKLEDFFAFFMGKVYEASALDLPLLRCLSQAGLRREARTKALEALVEGFAAISAFAAENGRAVSPHSPEQLSSIYQHSPSTLGKLRVRMGCSQALHGATPSSAASAALVTARSAVLCMEVAQRSSSSSTRGSWKAKGICEGDDEQLNPLFSWKKTGERSSRKKGAPHTGSEQAQRAAADAARN